MEERAVIARARDIQQERTWRHQSRRSERDGTLPADRLIESGGRLVEKNLHRCSGDRRKLVEPGNACISIRRQCKLLNLNRGTYYFEPSGESEKNRRLLAEIWRSVKYEELYLKEYRTLSDARAGVIYYCT